jgi:hypothetical protein
MDSTMPLRSDLRLAREYGEIFRFSVLGKIHILICECPDHRQQFFRSGFHVIFCSSYELRNELSDDTRFKKIVAGSLHESKTHFLVE